MSEISKPNKVVKRKFLDIGTSISCELCHCEIEDGTLCNRCRKEEEDMVIDLVEDQVVPSEVRKHNWCNNNFRGSNNFSKCFTENIVSLEDQRKISY
jgi:hypothetical protein